MPACWRRPTRAFLPDLAMALNNLGICSARWGGGGRRWPRPRRPSTLRRVLADGQPGAYLPDLAAALNNLGNRYSELGRRGEALAPTEEAVDLLPACWPRPTPPTCPTSPWR